MVVGAGPTGLLLACELGSAGVRSLVLEAHPAIRQTPRAGGLSGQILEVLRHRGELGRFESASTAPRPLPRFPWGGLHIDLTMLDDSPMQALLLPQPELERVLDAWAGELGAEVRRGTEVVGLRQDEESAIVEVRAVGATTEISAAFVVGCDGAGSRVRGLAGIPFPGTTYPEVQRLAEVTVPSSVSVLENGDVEVEGVGRIPFGFTRTASGEFAIGSSRPGALGVYTSEADPTAYDDDDEPMTIAELGDSIRRVLGIELPLGDPRRMTRFTFHARQVERYRDRRVLLAGDAAHLFPAPGVALNVGLLDSVNLGWKLAAEVQGWAPPGLLDTYDLERRPAGARTMLHTQAQVALRRGHDPAAVALRELFAELVTDEEPARRIGRLLAGSDVRYTLPGGDRHDLVGRFAPDLALGTRGSRPVLLDLAGRPDLMKAAGSWRHRVDARVVRTDRRPADALLVRPDFHVAWAAPVGEPAETAAPALREALAHWFGRPA